MRWLRRLSLALGGLVLCLVFVEAAFQFVYRFENGSWLSQVPAYKVGHILPQDDKRAYTYKPNFRDDNEGISIDQFGFRTSRSLPEPEPGSEVIVSLGDSVPFGHGLRDEQTYPYELSKLMAQAGSHLPVVNAGVQSYNLQQSIEHFYRDVLVHYRPVVVTLQAVNDVGLLLTYRKAWTPASTWQPYRQNTRFHLGASATFHYAMLFAAIVVGRWGENGLFAYPLDEMLANEQQLLQELISVCSAKGIKLILMPINPFYYQTKNRDKNDQLSRWAAWQAETMGWGSAIERFNDVLISVARRYGPQQGVYLFDVRQYLDGQDREPLYSDFIHHSPEGNRRVAQGLFEFIKEMEIVKL